MKLLYRTVFVITLVISASIRIDAQVQSDIDKVVQTLPKSTKTTIFIYDPETKDTLYQKDIFDEMIPASNMKLFTTSAALSLLGSDYKLTTSLLTDDMSSEGSVLNGNIYLKGYGNPTFSADDLKNFVDVLVNSGVKEITGKIIADDSYFDTNFSHGTVFVDGESNLTVPPVSALSLDRNTIYLRLIGGSSIGKKLDYSFTPIYSFITAGVDARITRFKSSPRVSYLFTGNKIKIRVLGGMNYKQKGSNYLIYIENPALYCVLAFQEKLKKAGIKITGEAEEGRTPNHARELTSSSVRLNEILPTTNKNSDNFYAESLFKLIGAKYSGSIGNAYYGGLAIKKFLQDKSILQKSVNIADGSGISRSNRISANLIVRLLDYMYHDKSVYSDFYNSLSISGVDGTLRDRMTSQNLSGSFHGKTGTIYGVSTISGYLSLSSGKTVIVSILMSFSEKGYHVHKNAQDEIIKIIAGQK